jgi:hypothetical protein
LKKFSKKAEVSKTVTVGIRICCCDFESAQTITIKFTHQKSYRPKPLTHTTVLKVKNFISYNFFIEHFSHEIFGNIFHGFEISVKYCEFCLQIFAHISTSLKLRGDYFVSIKVVFQNFEGKYAKNNSRKRKKIFFVSVSQN